MLLPAAAKISAWACLTTAVNYGLTKYNIKNFVRKPNKLGEYLNGNTQRTW